MICFSLVMELKVLCNYIFVFHNPKDLTFSSHPPTTITTTSAATTKPAAVTTITESSPKPTTQITTAHSTPAHTSDAAVVSTMTTREDHSVTVS